MSTAADIRIVTSLEGLQGVTSGLNQIGKSAEGVSGSMGRATAAMASTGETLKSVGTTMTIGISAPLAAWGAQILKTTADFDTQMRTVGQLMGGGTEKVKQNVDQLSKVALQLGKDTAFSASEVAQGFGVLAQAGYDANETVKLTKSIINLAGAEMLDFDRATRITTDTMNQFGFGIEDADTIINKFVTTGAISKTSVDELASAFEKVGPVSRASNQSLDEMLVTLATLADTGIKGEVAGTALAAALSRLQDPPKAARIAMEELNLTIWEAPNKMRPFTDIVQELAEKGANLGQVNALMTAEAGRYIIAMLNSTAAAKKYSEELGGPLLSAADIARVKMEGLTGAWNGFTGSLETLNITLGKAGLEEWAIDILNAGAGLVDMLTELNPDILRFGSAVAVAAAAAGPIIVGLGLMAAAVGAIGAPVALAIAGVAALGAALWTFRDRLAPIAQAAAPLWDGIATAWTASLAKIRAVYDQIVAGFSDGVLPGIRNAASVLSTFLSQTFSAFATSYPALVRSAGTKIAEAMGGWFGPDVQRLIQGGVNALATGMQTWLAAIPKAITFIRTAVTSAWRFVFGDFSGVTAALADLGNKLKAAVATVANQFQISLSGGIGTAFGAAVGAIASGGIKLVQGIVALVPKLAQGVLSLFSGIKWDQTEGIVARGITVVGDAIEDFFKGFAQGFEAATGITLKGIGSKAVGLIVRGIKALPGAILDAIEELWDIGPEVGAAVEKLFSNLGGSIVQGLTSAVDRAKAMLGNVWTTLFDRAGDSAQDMARKVAEAAESVGSVGNAAKTSIDDIGRFSAGLKTAADSAKMVGGSASDTIDSLDDMGESISGAAEDLDILGSAGKDMIGVTEDLSAALSRSTGQLELVGSSGSDTIDTFADLGDQFDRTASDLSKIDTSAREVVSASRDLTPALQENADALRLVGSSGTDSLDSLEDGWDSLDGTIGQITDSMTDAVSTFVTTGKVDLEGLKDTAIRVGSDMLKDGIRSFATEATKDLLGFSTDSAQAFGVVKETGGGAWDWIRDHLFESSDTWGSTLQDFQGESGGIFDTIRGYGGTAWNWIRNSLGGSLPEWKGLLGGFKGDSEGIFSAIREIGGSAWSWIRDSLLKGIPEWISGLKGFVTSATGVFSGLSGGIGKTLSAIGSGIMNFISSVGQGASDLAGDLVSGITSFFFTDGGPVPGGPRGTDTVPAWLTPGEFVVNKEAASKYRDLLESLNSGGFLGGRGGGNGGGSGVDPNPSSGWGTGFGLRSVVESGGSLLGAVLGSVAGPVGTAAGGWLGGFLGRKAYDNWEEKDGTTVRGDMTRQLGGIRDVTQNALNHGDWQSFKEGAREMTDLQNAMNAGLNASKVGSWGAGLLAGAAGITGPIAAVAKSIGAELLGAVGLGYAEMQAPVDKVSDEIGAQFGFSSGGIWRDWGDSHHPGRTISPQAYDRAMDSKTGNDAGWGGGGGGGGNNPGGHLGGAPGDIGGGHFATGGWVKSADSAYKAVSGARVTMPAGGWVPERAFATGGDSIFTRETMIRVGEAGPERVRVEKLTGDRDGGGGSGAPVIIAGPMIANGLTMNQFTRDLVDQADRERRRRRGWGR